MADIKFLDDLTQCPICFKQYQRPRCLPCLHTFCEKCIDEYIVSVVRGKDSREGFNCPVCRHFIKAPSSDLDEIKWAEKFPLNYLVLTLIDQKSLQQGKLFCSPCKKKSKSEQSASWCIQCKISLCTNCADFHTSVPILENHSVVPLGEKEDETSLLSSGHILCGINTDKPIEMYCLDHEVPCCSTCTMITHRRCENVDTLQNVAVNAKTSKVRAELEEGFSNQLKIVEESLRNDAENLEILGENCKQVKSKVIQKSEDAISHLKCLTEKAISDVCHLEDKKKIMMTGTLEMQKGRKATIENCQKLLKASLEQSSDEQFFLESKKLMRKLQEIQKEMLELQPIASSDVSFSYAVRKEISGLVAYDALGEIDYDNAKTDDKNPNQSIEGISDSPQVTVDDFKGREGAFPIFTLEDMEQVEIESRRQNSYVSGCTFLEDGRLVTADYKKRRSREGILKVYEKDFKTSETIPLEGKPWAVASLNSSYIIVTLPNVSKMLVLDVVTFGSKQTISCERMYFGLAVQNQLPNTSSLSEDDRELCRMFVSSKGDIFLLNLNGETLKQFSISDSYVRYVAYCPGRLLCSVEKKVICIDEKGQILFEVFDTDLHNPAGIAVGKNDHIVVCDYDGGKVFIVDSKGFKRSVLIAKPDASYPAFNKDQDKLCVITGGPIVVNKACIYNVRYL